VIFHGGLAQHVTSTQNAAKHITNDVLKQRIMMKTFTAHERSMKIRLTVWNVQSVTIWQEMRMF